MRAEFLIDKAKQDCVHVLKLGEVALKEVQSESGISYRTVVGDGKTSVNDLPSLADYDIHSRVVALEQEIKKLREIIKDQGELP